MNKPANHFGNGDDESRSANQELLALHERLLHGDQAARDEIAVRLLAFAENALRLRFPRLDQALVHDAASDALGEYLIRPQMFRQSSNARLDHFFEWRARRDLGHLVRAEVRRKKAEGKAAEEFLNDSVELCRRAGYLWLEDPSDALMAKEKWDERARILKDPRDREILALWKSGEWHTEAFAKVLGIEGLPPAEQCLLVKRAKDRISKMLRRH